MAEGEAGLGNLGRPVVAALVLVAILASLGAAVGLDVPRDGLTYLDMAGDLVEGRGFADPGYEDTVHFPPGFPVAVAAVSTLGLPVRTAALLVNATAWAATVLGMAALYRRAGGTENLNAWLLLLWVAGGGTFTAAYTSALSEGLFLAVSVWALVVSERWLAGRSRGLALLTWLLCAASVSVRYVGLMLIAALALRVLQERRPVIDTIRAMGWVASSVVPVALWYVSYRDVPGAADSSILAGSFSLDSIFHSLGALAAIFVGGLPYNEDSTIVAAAIDPLLRVVLATIGLALSSVVMVCLWRRVRGAWAEGGLARLLDQGRAGGWLGPLDLALCSLALLVAWRFAGGYHILARYWLVALVPLVGVVAARSPELRWRGSPTPSPWLRLASVGAGVLVVANVVVSLKLIVA